jgi:uncharacterized membrane protein
LHRDLEKRDRAGVIVFGEDAAVEIPPIDEYVPLPPATENQLDARQTNLARALKLAQALFPHDSAKRVVVVSDGNQTRGDALARAKVLADAGVSIDVAPIHWFARGEVAVEKLTVSSDVRRGQPFDLRVVLNNITEPKPGERGAVKGKLRIVRRAGERETTMAEQEIELPPGKKVFTIRQQIDRPDFYTYEARFVPDDPADDAMSQNNEASTFTHIRGRGHVLVIEDWKHPGQFDFLVDRLRSENLEVTLLPSDQLFNSLAELQRYDTVVLANVPRSSGENADEIANFSDAQIEMLARNTQQMGSGLIMLGGDRSFGVGGWSNTEIEKAMPVDFHVKSPKVVPVGALAMLMHASEMARGNHWQKVVAREAIKSLGGQDYCGVIHWNGNDQWLWRHPQGFAKVGPQRQQMLARLDKMQPGDMPQFEPAMRMAAASFAQLPDAAVKHMIIISDGDPAPPSNAVLQALKQQKVTVTTVAVGSHGTLGSTPMQKIARVTGGKYYVVKNGRALPRIYQREARRIARPLVFEDKNGLAPQVKFPHEMIKGLADEEIPPVTGFVLTSVKDNPLVEVALVSPKPAGDKNATLLAAWTYGLGKAVAFTTDAGQRWAGQWTDWDGYDKFFSQMVRWSMRPTGDAGNFALAGGVEQGKGTVVITALDKDDEFLNFLNMTGSAFSPDGKALPLRIEQVAPGRYVGEAAVDRAGDYFLAITPAAGKAALRAGVSVPYSAEFRDRRTNLPLLEALAQQTPKGGEAGLLLDGDFTANLPSLLAVNTFRPNLPKVVSVSDVWPLLAMIAASLLFFDVLLRRLRIDVRALLPIFTIFRHRAAVAPAADERIARLRSRKAAIEQQVEDRRAAARFEPQNESAAEPRPELSPPNDLSQLPRSATADLSPQASAGDQATYTERLLAAKKKLRRPS